MVDAIKHRLFQMEIYSIKIEPTRVEVVVSWVVYPIREAACPVFITQHREVILVKE